MPECTSVPRSVARPGSQLYRAASIAMGSCRARREVGSWNGCLHGNGACMQSCDVNHALSHGNRVRTMCNRDTCHRQSANGFVDLLFALHIQVAGGFVDRKSVV